MVDYGWLVVDDFADFQPLVEMTDFRIRLWDGATSEVCCLSTWNDSVLNCLPLDHRLLSKLVVYQGLDLHEFDGDDRGLSYVVPTCNVTSPRIGRFWVMDRRRNPQLPWVQELQNHSEDHKGRHAEMAEHVVRLKQEKATATSL